MAVTPKYETYNFCYWLQNLSWQRLTTPQFNLVTLIASASQNQTSVTDQQWKDFNMISSSRFAYYQQWVSLSIVESGYLNTWLSSLPSRPPSWFIASVSRFIDNLVNGGVWSQLDRLWLFASPLSSISVYSLVNPSASVCTLVNSPSFTPYLGFTGNGVNSYINTQFNPRTQGVFFTTNSASMGVFTRIQASVSSGKCIMGSADGTYYDQFQLRFTGDKMRAIMNSGASDILINNTITTGFSSSVRSSSALLSVYTNGILLGSGTPASSNTPNSNILLLARPGADFDTNQISLAYCGSSAIDQKTFYGAIYQLSREIGFNV